MKRYPFVIVYCGPGTTMFQELSAVIACIEHENENYVLRYETSFNYDYNYLSFKNKNIKEIEKELKDFITLKEII